MKTTSIFLRIVFCSLISAVFFISSAEARGTNEFSDLSVTLSSPVATATNGEWVTFYVTGKNNGPDPIYADDTCEIQCSPAAGQYGDDGAGGGDPSDAVVSGVGTIDKSWWDIHWFPGAFAPGQSKVMTVQIPLNIRDESSLNAATATGNYSNHGTYDKNLGNNDDSLQLGYEPASDLSITIDDGGNDSWELGSGYYELNLTVSNKGPSVASGAVVTNILPLGCTYNIDWPDDPADYSFDGNILTWNISDHNEEGSTSLWHGVTASMTLWITPTNAGEKVVSSELYHLYDPDPSNNTAENSMPVTGSSGGGGGGDVSLQLMGWDVVPTVERYGIIEYVLRLKNNGAGAVTNVVVTNLLDSRCIFDSASTPQGSFSQTEGTVVYDVGTVSSGADFNLGLKVIPLESGTMVNDARVYMDATGNEYGDSAVIEETTVNPGPEALTITPMTSVTPTFGFRDFEAVVHTNGQDVAGVTLYAEITRGPHMGGSSNTVTTSYGPGANAMFFLEDDEGYPGMDYITVTGKVGKIPLRVDLQAEWQMMEPLTYACTNLGFITEDGLNVFSIDVPDGFEIADIQTGLHFEHTYPSDLEFRLYSPTNFGDPEIEAYLIETNAAFAFDDLEVGRSNSFCILDEAAVTSISDAVAPFSGSFSSQFLEMTNYVGAESMGTWFLVIEDMNPDPSDFDYGELLGWTLTLEPADGDLDNDGMNDPWELANGLDPNDPTDADDDDDGDGLSNRSEFRTRRSPQNPSDSFSVTLPIISDGEFILYWSSTSNQFYTIRWCTNLLNGFVNILDSGIPATPPENEYAVTNNALKKAFFKIEQEY